MESITSSNLIFFINRNHYPHPTYFNHKLYLHLHQSHILFHPYQCQLSTFVPSKLTYPIPHLSTLFRPDTCMFHFTIILTYSIHYLLHSTTPAYSIPPNNYSPFHPINPLHYMKSVNGFMSVHVLRDYTYYAHQFLRMRPSIIHRSWPW
jgi:hypothetical protein